MQAAMRGPLLEERAPTAAGPPEIAGPRARGPFVRPQLVALLCVAVLAGAGWIYLGLMVAAERGHDGAAALGPGMGVFDRILPADGMARAAIDSLCRPFLSGSRATAPHALQFREIALVLMMWSAMVLAMMLPTAGPMLMTYAEIAETAAAKGEDVVPPPVLAAGYVAVWIGFAFAAGFLQLGLGRLALLDPTLKPVSGLFSGAVFLLAGAYQFSALKHACVTRCQRPFPFFFANWSVERGQVFRLGVQQGAYCLGCCWAMMLVMFAVGVMNVVWMAVLGAVMAAEKISTTTRLSRVFGVVLSAIGLALVIAAAAAHWPVHAG